MLENVASQTFVKVLKFHLFCQVRISNTVLCNWVIVDAEKVKPSVFLLVGSRKSIWLVKLQTKNLLFTEIKRTTG